MKLNSCILNYECPPKIELSSDITANVTAKN